ncbi:Sec-independent protein translocase protein TatB [Aliikangiella sp. IMCC44359]|uniref:Sec-independent protein translocase protein TatB n=1 Tax=Aliikangiella sp. IMCC44359 TaxID=3459125 RepID=UPI00403B05E8
MFDIGFLELLVIGIIALLVLGPERLPKAARTVGLWVGKAKQSFNTIKTEIDRELKIQEIQQQLKEQKNNLEQQLEINSIKETLSEAEKDINHIAAEVNHPLDSNTINGDAIDNNSVAEPATTSDKSKK